VVALDADPLGGAERDLSRHPVGAVDEAPDDLREASRRVRAKPGGVGEGQPPEGDVVEPGVRPSGAHDQLLQHRCDDRYAPRILPPAWQVVQDMAARPGTVEVPATRLAKQAEAVLDVCGSGGPQPPKLRVVCLLEIAPARLVEFDQAPLRVTADAGNAAAGLGILNPLLALLKTTSMSSGRRQDCGTVLRVA
jgi:hypothetical protein